MVTTACEPSRHFGSPLGPRSIGHSSLPFRQIAITLAQPSSGSIIPAGVCLLASRIAVTSRQTFWSAQTARGQRCAASLCRKVQPHYVGYVVLCGTIEERNIPPDLVRFFDQSLTFCEGRSGGHIVCYFIRGAYVATEDGGRRLNWVWYVRVPDGPQLNRFLTDKHGALQDASVSAAMAAEACCGGARVSRSRAAPAFCRASPAYSRSVCSSHHRRGGASHGFRTGLPCW